VAALRADVERFCSDLVVLAPAIRLGLVTELRAALDEVTTPALTAGMTAAQQQGWGLRRTRSSPASRMSRSGGCSRLGHPGRLAGGDRPMTVPVQELLAEGRAALRAGDAAEARRALEQVLATSPSGEVLEGLARAAYLALDFEQAIREWEQAYAAFRGAGDQLGMVRVARTLSGLYLTIVGNRAVSSGWLARAQTLLGAADSVEAGWVGLNLGMFEGDRGRKEEHFRAALQAARRFGDADLEVVTLAYLGASLVHGDRIEEGMVLLDEALAAVLGSEVDDFFVLEEVFCQLFSACEHAQDVTRAEQWIPVGEAIA
jgi:tetratricopeptide (TPR) repeat protein